MPHPYEVTQKGSHAFTWPDWHSDCLNVSMIIAATGPMLWCPECRCAVNLEAVSEKVTIESSRDKHPNPPANPAP